MEESEVMELSESAPIPEKQLQSTVVRLNSKSLQKALAAYIKWNFLEFQKHPTASDSYPFGGPI